MRLLVIEDEAKTAAYLAKGLGEHGYVIDVAPNGEEGLHLALEGAHDLIVLDLMLPKKDGWAVLRELRAADRHVPVLILTARDAVDERVAGLDLGADDYVVKPFAFSELLSRIRALLRRSAERPENNNTELVVGDLVLNLITRRAHRRGTRLDLTAKEFTLLWLLMRHRGEVLSRTLIAEKVWDMNFDSDTNVVEVAVRRLRRKIDEPFGRPLIHTVRGMGYVLEDR
jgi:two-component system copper resistance phosphate regulon response regulator CusR